MQRLVFQRVDAGRLPSLDGFADRTLYQTREWLDFLVATQRGEPVHALLWDGSRVAGRFVGLIVRKGGLRVLGSPCPGWTTSYMGFNLEPDISRLDALLALRTFAFRELGCVHFEIMDRQIRVEEVERAGLHCEVYRGFELDLSRSEDDLLKAMKNECRRCIRAAEKRGVVVDEVADEQFVENYYLQLQDVFGKQQLVPTYSKERVGALVEHLRPTGRLLLVTARDPAGRSIATGIFPALHDTMFLWGAASYRADQSRRPNEAVQWFAMRYWKERGITRYDMGGGGKYKRKYGGKEIAVPWVFGSRFRALDHLRSAAKELVRAKQRVLGMMTTLR